MNKILTVPIAALIVAALSVPASAASSAWFTTDGARMRLISLPSPDGKLIDAGLQIELAKGWKTYWRSPGASGLPPQISFSGSKNIAATKLNFPIPTTFGDAQNLTAGYKKSVTFPIAVEPLFAGRPLTLNATGLVGICGEICVPVQFQLSLTEDGRGVSSRDVASALFQSRAELMQPAHENFRVTKAVFRNSAKRELLVTAKVPDQTTQSALFLEGPDDWYLTPARAEKIENGIAEFRVNLDDIPKNAKPGETRLRFSIVAHGEGVEQELTPTQ